MKLSKGVAVLNIAVTMMNAPAVIYPVLIQDENSNILVDSGYPGDSSLAQLTKALEDIGVKLTDLTDVILTHQDIDHIGGLRGLKIQNPGLKIWAHMLEKPYVEGEKKLVKISPAVLENLKKMPKEMSKRLLYVFENPPTAPVDFTVEDGQQLDICGGITVIHTPGHTPGHICLYLHASRTLIAGDALTAHEGTLLGPVPEHAADISQTMASLKKLLAFDIERIVCYHGGVVECGATRIKEIINEA